MSRTDCLKHSRLLKELHRERKKVNQLQEIIRQLHKRLEDKPHRGGAKPRQPTTPPTVGTTPRPPTSDQTTQ